MAAQDTYTSTTATGAAAALAADGSRFAVGVTLSGESYITFGEVSDGSKGMLLPAGAYYFGGGTSLAQKAIYMTASGDDVSVGFETVLY